MTAILLDVPSTTYRFLKREDRVPATLDLSGVLYAIMGGRHVEFNLDDGIDLRPLKDS